MRRTGLTVLREMASTHSMQLISSSQEEGTSSHFLSNALWPQMVHLYQELCGKKQNLIRISELYWYSHHETYPKVQLSKLVCFCQKRQTILKIQNLLRGIIFTGLKLTFCTIAF